MADWLTHPGLTRQAFPQRLAWSRKPAMILLHSTEGSSWPGYGGGASAPHFTVDPRKRQARQHFPLSSAARALANAPGGVETNRGGPIQIEIIGTCDPRNKKLPSVLTLDDGAMKYLAGLLKAIAKECGIPATCSVTFKAYPGSYGLRASQRLSGSKWKSYRGILGHQHAPENDHGDPGAFPVGKLIAAMGGTASSSTTVKPTPAPAPKPSGSKAPAFPLPKGSVFGPKSGPASSVSGFFSHRSDLKKWQRQMKARGWTIDDDGLYGPQTEKVAKQFQAEKRLGRRDGRIDPETWAAAWTAPRT